MRITAVLLFAGCLQVSASGFGQKVNINGNNIPLRQIFKDIKKQTGYMFFYNASLLANTHPVDIHVRDADLFQVLEQSLRDQPLVFNIVNKTIVISAKAPATGPPPPPRPQTDTVPSGFILHGQVVDAATGAPIPGASIQIKSTKIGVPGDQHGEFHIPASRGATLVVSSLGYEEKTILIKDANLLVIKLAVKANKDPMTDAVVTGYQVINRESFTGAAVTVSGEDLKKNNPQNVLRSLQTFDPSFKILENTLTGSNPNALPNITVRGSTALPSGSSDAISRTNLTGSVNLPTFILDGYEVSLQKVYDLDINRIKSITLLKDAAATAVYGSRASNGVVVITTNPPKSGELQLSYNYELNVSVADLSQYHVLDAKQKLQYEVLAGLYDGSKNTALSQDQLDQYYYHKKAYVVGGVNTYWLSQPIRNTAGQKHSIFIEGGENSMRYGLGLRYQTMPGVMKGSTRDRYSTDLLLSYMPNNRFQFRNTISLTLMNAKESPFGDFSDYVRANPYYQKTDSSGHIIQEIDRWTDRSGAGGGVTSYPTLNPLFNATLGSFNKTSYLEVIDAFAMDWTIGKGFRMRGTISLNQKKTTQDKFLSPFANDYYESTDYKPGERGRYDYGNQVETTIDGTVSLNYNRQIGQHFLNFVLGSNIRTYASNNKAIAATGFSNDRFTDIGYATTYAKSTTPYSDIQKERLAGAFLSLNYTYNNKYLMDFTFREDGSSKFGSDRRIAPFSALGLAWNLHKEAFLKGTAISRLKVRASTGVTGSVSFSPYMARATYTYQGANQYSTGIGAIIDNFGNDRLQWQKTTSDDLGVELGLFKDRVLIMPRYYRKMTRGLVADVTLAPSTGFTSYKDNVGDMLNKGYELNIQLNVLHTRDWNLNLNVNLVRNTNTIVKVSNALKAYNDKVDQYQDSSAYKGAPLTRYKEGQSLDAIYAVRSLGIDPENGRELYIRKDGTLTYDYSIKDIVPVGVTTPKAEGYIYTNVGYKHFSLNLSFYTRFGGLQYNQTLVDRVENADPHYNVDSRVFADKWKQSGDHTFYKNIADLGSTQVSSRFVQKDNILDLQSVYFGYDFDRSIARKAGAKSCRLAFTMNDVWRWSSIRQERGIDYPYAHSFTLALTAGF